MMMLMNKKGLEIEIQSPSDFSNYGTAKQTDVIYYIYVINL